LPRKNHDPSPLVAIPQRTKLDGYLHRIRVAGGRFLGIQVANWNSDRENRSREKMYLASLVEDVRSDIVEIDTIIRVSTARMSALNYLIRNATGEDLPRGFDSVRGKIVIEDAPAFDENDQNTIGVTLFILSNLDGNRLTYDTMINTGGIGIFRDDTLVREIRSYYANVDPVHSFDVALQESRWKLVDAQQQSGQSPVDVLPAREMTKAFAEDKQLLAAAKNYWLHTNRHIKDMKELRQHADALLTRIESEGRVVFWGEVINYGKQAIRYAETGEMVDGSAWKTVLAFYQASQIWQWGTADATYQEMRSGGELGLIRDQVLRDAMSQYYLESGPGNAYLFALQPEYRKIVRGLTPLAVADHIWAKCWKQPIPGEQYLLDCDSPISEAQAQAVLAGYPQDPSLLPELRFWVANQGVALNAIGNYKPILRDMLAREKSGTAQ